MKVINQAAELTHAIKSLKAKGKSVGFVPTMGALHNGHISLTRHAAEENDVVVVSIFVNPTQFNDKDDLKKYPRTLEADSKLLSENGIDFLFYPTVEEIYPDDENHAFDYSFGGMENELEGKHRPGHFNGVGQVVKRLLEIAIPDNLYMGQKDFQQFSLINYMINDLNIPVTLRVAPIIREKDGLAMSSRNVRLSAKDRKQAPILHTTLEETKLFIDAFTVKELEEMAMNKFASVENFKPEYFTISDGYTLKDIVSVEDHDFIVASLAVWVGDVRLIDNMILKNDSSARLLI